MAEFAVWHDITLLVLAAAKALLEAIKRHSAGLQNQANFYNLRTIQAMQTN